jgi:hypothetical protein
MEVEEVGHQEPGCERGELFSENQRRKRDGSSASGVDITTLIDFFS